MNMDNWINLISAIIVGGGTLFLGIMAWLTIRQTRNIRKAEKREKLLKEIIEWALDSGQTNLLIEHKTSNEEITYFANKLANRTFQVLTKGIYVNSIVKEMNLDNNLQIAVEELNEVLGLYINILEKFEQPNDAIIEKTQEYWWQSVYKAITGVVEKATKIKTEDIS